MTIVLVDVTDATDRVLLDVAKERTGQDEKWGSQRHLPDGTSDDGHTKNLVRLAKEANDQNAKNGEGNWADILEEEVWEALVETDPVKIRAELVQVAAVAVAWIESIDSRSK